MQAKPLATQNKRTSEIAEAVQAGKADILSLWAAVERFAWQQTLRWVRAMEGRAGVEESDLLQVAFISLMDTLPTWDVNKGEFLTLYGIIRLRKRYHYRPLRKNSAAAHEKERIIYTMSEFNIYARKLDTAFKEARSEYNTAFRALQEAQQASRDANAWKPGDSAEEKQIRTTRAALKLHDAEATFDEVSARVWDNFKATRRTIRAELEQAVRAANIANPDEIDNNALELMKTGVLSPADYSAFMERFDSNHTMLKGGFKTRRCCSPPCWLVRRTVTLREYNKHRQSKSPQECSCGLSALHERIYRQTVDR